MVRANAPRAVDEAPIVFANLPRSASAKFTRPLPDKSLVEVDGFFPKTTNALTRLACSHPRAGLAEESWNMVSAERCATKEELNNRFDPSVCSQESRRISGHFGLRLDSFDHHPHTESFKQVRGEVQASLKGWQGSKYIGVLRKWDAAKTDDTLVAEEVTLIAGETFHTPQIFLSDCPIVIFGESREEIRFHCEQLETFLSRKDTLGSLANVAYNVALQQNRTLEYNLSFVCNSIEELSKRLRKATAGTVELNRRPSQEPLVILCFGGQDGAIAHITKVLYDNSVLLQGHLDECSTVCTKKLSLPSLFPTIFSPEPIQDVAILHCTLFSIQYACAKSWLDSGLKVDRIIGYSFGQLTALCVAGSISLVEALQLVLKRARLIEKHSGSKGGLMLAVEVSDVGQLLRLAQQRYPNFSGDIACFNGPRNFVIAGDEMSIQAVEKASAALRADSRSRRLPDTHAVHHKHLDSILPEL